MHTSVDARRPTSRQSLAGPQERSRRQGARRLGARVVLAVVTCSVAIVGVVVLRAPQDVLRVAGPSSPGHACPRGAGSSGVQSTGSYVDVLQLGGRGYERLRSEVAPPVIAEGAPLGATVCRTAGSGDPYYLLRDLDASLLPVGTVLRQVSGFDPAFRLAAEVPGGPVLYEARFPAPTSRTGADVFPGLRQHVVAVAAAGIDDGREFRRITDPVVVRALLDDLLVAPVRLNRKDLSGRADGFLDLVLDDGTSVQRAYHGGDGVLAPGLTLSPASRRTVASLFLR